MLTPASAATSLRRNPGTRRRPWLARPACSGVTLARRETRNSRTSARLSTPLTVRRAPARRDSLSVHPSTEAFWPASGAAFLHGMHTTLRQPARPQAVAVPAAVALVTLLAVLVAVFAGDTAATPSATS